MGTDIFADYYKRKDEIEHKRRRDLIKRFGKQCKACGGTEMVPAPDSPGGRKPCPSCNYKRRNVSHKH